MMDDAQLQRDVTQMRIASALERIANHYERQDALQEAERIAHDRWCVEIARSHLSASVEQEEPSPVESDSN